MLGSFAEFEREMLRERTKLGLARARAEGRVGGNRAKLTPKQQIEALKILASGRSQSEVAEIFRVHRSTISRLCVRGPRPGAKIITIPAPKTLEPPALKPGGIKVSHRPFWTPIDEEQEETAG